MPLSQAGLSGTGPQSPAAPGRPIAPQSAARCRPSEPGGTRAARRHFLLRPAGLSALSRARGRSLCCPAAHGLPPLVPGARSQAKRQRGLFQERGPRAGWGVPVRFVLPASVRAGATLQRSARTPTGKPEHRLTPRRAPADSENGCGRRRGLCAVGARRARDRAPLARAPPGCGGG
ncbi:unnamed protein product [Coccothraustes coccothraustes]